MCRRFCVWSCVLIAFGTGVLLSICLESVLVRLGIGGSMVFVGLYILKR